MKVVIDTSSIMSLVRYYLPFDKNRSLYNNIMQKISEGEIIIIDKVYRECELNSRGIVVNSIAFLRDRAFLKSAKLPYKTEFLLPPDAMTLLGRLENEFVNIHIRRNLTEAQFQSRKSSFVEGADWKQIVLCLNLQSIGEDVVLVTEETEYSNDSKPFQKIPAICKGVGVKTMTLPELLEEYNIELEFLVPAVVVKPICERCMHYAPLFGSCEAFPDIDGIPKIILESNRHDKPIDGQKNEVIFSPIT
jgi:hypothetical protein